MSDNKINNIPSVPNENNPSNVPQARPMKEFRALLSRWVKMIMSKKLLIKENCKGEFIRSFWAIMAHQRTKLWRIKEKGLHSAL